MAMFPETQDPLGPTGASGNSLPPKPSSFQEPPDYWASIRGAFQDNTVYAGLMHVARTVSAQNFPPDPNYEIMDDIKGSYWEANYLSSFIGVQSRAEKEYIQNQIKQREYDQQQYASSGWVGTAVSLASGFLDPTSYIPIAGEAGLAAKETGVLARSIRFAKAGAVGGALNEGVLQATQDGRSVSDAVWNIGSQTLLMGILGAAHGYFLPDEKAPAVKSLDEMRRDFQRTQQEADTASNIPMTPDDLGLGMSKPGAAGAAVADTREMKQKPFAPVPQSWRDASPLIDKVATGFERLNNKLSPIGRLLDSESGTVRRETVELAETVRTFEQNESKSVLDANGNQLKDVDGNPVFTQPQTTTRDGNVPISRLAKMVIEKGKQAANDSLLKNYADYRYNGNDPSFAGIRQGIEELRGKTNDGKLTYSQFKTEVSKALYSDDKHDIPQVASAAKEVRSKVFEPVLNRAQRTIGPDGKPMIAEGDIRPKGDPSFFARIWNKVALAAKRGEAVKTFADWLESEQVTKAAAQSRLESLANSRSILRAHMADLKSRISTIDKKLTENIGAQRERVLELNAADRRENTVGAQASSIADDIAELQNHIDAMRDMMRDPAGQQRLKDLEQQVADLRRAERESQMSPAKLAAQDKNEIESTFGSGDYRKAAEIVVGKRKAPKSDSFINYIQREGGILSDGETREVLKDVKRPGLLRKTRNLTGRGQIIRDADDWGEKLMSDFPHAFQERPTANEVLNIIRDAASGKEPWFMQMDRDLKSDAASHINSMVDAIHDHLEHIGEPVPTTLKDLARILNRDPGATLSQMEEQWRQMEAAGAGVPKHPGELDDASAKLIRERQARNEIRSSIQDSIARRNRAKGELSKANVRLDEARVPVARSENRFADLQERGARHQLIRDALDEAQSNAQGLHDDITKKIEDELRQWQGNSAADAIAALNARDKAELNRAAQNAARTPEDLNSIPDAEWTDRLQTTLDELSKRFGLNGPLKLNHGTIATPTGERANGVARIGKREVGVDPSQGRHQQILTLYHEVGHFIQADILNKLSAQELAPLLDAHDRWRSNIKGSTKVDDIRAQRPPGEGAEGITYGQLADRHQKYLASFEEWFADQTRVWLSKSDAPRTLADRIFKRVSDAWKQLYRMATGRFGLAKEVDAFMKGRFDASNISKAEIREMNSRVSTGRLASADGAVDRSLDRILKSDRDKPRADLESRANEIIDRILSSPDGRLNYENGGRGPEIGAFTNKQEVRGSLNERPFAIPSKLAAPFMEHDTEHVIAGFLRSVVPDILMTDRFGDAQLEGVMRRINEDYAQMSSRAKSEAEATKIEAARQRDIRDMAAIRDRIKNVYGWSPDPRMRNAARIAGAFRNWNALTDMGTSVVARMNELSNPVFRFGFQRVLQSAWLPYFRGLTGISKEGFVGRSRAQMKAMGIGIDGALGHSSHNLADVVDSYRPGSKFENTLATAADRSMLVNLHTQQTDEMKMMAGAAAAAEFLTVAERIATNKHSAADLTQMAQANITPARAKAIWFEFSKPGGGEMIDGAHVPNTANWHPDVRTSFEAAMQKEVEMVVMMPGQEKPLWISHPVAGLLGQYKGVISAMHERLFIANLQQRDFRTLQGLFGNVALGMLSYRIYTLLSDQEASDRPQDWIKEGLARSGALGWLTEANAMQSRFTGGATDMFRLIGADKPLSVHQARSALSEVLGPTWSKLEGISDAIQDFSMHKTDGTNRWNSMDTHKMRQLLFLQNLFFLRNLLDKAEDGINNSLGVKPLDRTPRSPGQPVP